MAPRVLLVDDEANILRMLGALLRAEGFTVDQAANGHAALQAVQDHPPDAVLLDLLMPPPGPDGLAVLAELQASASDVPVIMMSGKAGLQDAVRATQLGAFQFLEKPLSPESVLTTLRAALQLHRTRVENRALRLALSPAADLVGDSPAMRGVRELIAQVAPTEARVLVTGESGTGKELVAAAIHRQSLRQDHPFVPVNCAAIPRDLIESELFGHERGAFTGAVDRRLGRFELADGGTLFLDEVGDLGLEAQAKVLRTLETGQLDRIGSETSTPVDVRIIAATNHRLELAVESTSFREDLFFRLAVFLIPIPPLRERLEDLPALVAHLARRIRPRTPPTFTSGALNRLADYVWPGNVRELANVVERATILAGPEIDEADIRRVLQPAPKAALPAPRASGPRASMRDALADYERSLIQLALERASGNVSEAARALDTDRANLYRRMKRLGISPGN